MVTPNLSQITHNNLQRCIQYQWSHQTSVVWHPTYKDAYNDNGHTKPQSYYAQQPKKMHAIPMVTSNLGQITPNNLQDAYNDNGHTKPQSYYTQQPTKMHTMTMITPNLSQITHNNLQRCIQCQWSHQTSVIWHPTYKDAYNDNGHTKPQSYYAQQPTKMHAIPMVTSNLGQITPNNLQDAYNDNGHTKPQSYYTQQPTNMHTTKMVTPNLSHISLNNLQDAYNDNVMSHQTSVRLHLTTYKDAYNDNGHTKPQSNYTQQPTKMHTMPMVTPNLSQITPNNLQRCIQWQWSHQTSVALHLTT